MVVAHVKVCDSCPQLTVCVRCLCCLPCSAGPLFSASLQSNGCPKLKCALVVAKCAAKIVEAYNKKDPKIILTCTDKEHICTCADCLPSSIAAWLKKALGCASTSVLRGSHAYATSGCDASGQAQEDNDLELSVNDCTDVVSVRFNFVRCCDGCRASTFETSARRCLVMIPMLCRVALCWIVLIHRPPCRETATQTPCYYKSAVCACLRCTMRC
jgi:hypothetical protein